MPYAAIRTGRPQRLGHDDRNTIGRVAGVSVWLYFGDGGLYSLGEAVDLAVAGLYRRCCTVSNFIIPSRPDLSGHDGFKHFVLRGMRYRVGKNGRTGLVVPGGDTVGFCSLLPAPASAQSFDGIGGEEIESKNDEN